MANSADPDLDVHCLQRQGISEFSRTRVKDTQHCQNGLLPSEVVYPNKMEFFLLESIFKQNVRMDLVYSKANRKSQMLLPL